MLYTHVYEFLHKSIYTSISIYIYLHVYIVEVVVTKLVDDLENSLSNIISVEDPAESTTALKENSATVYSLLLRIRSIYCLFVCYLGTFMNIFMWELCMCFYIYVHLCTMLNVYAFASLNDILFWLMFYKHI